MGDERAVYVEPSGPTPIAGGGHARPELREVFVDLFSRTAFVFRFFGYVSTFRRGERPAGRLRIGWRVRVLEGQRRNGAKAKGDEGGMHAGYRDF
jgi:hypothetical protein